MTGQTHWRLTLFLLLCVACVLTMVLFGLAVRHRSPVSPETSLSSRLEPSKSDVTPMELPGPPATADRPNPAMASQGPREVAPETGGRRVGRNVPPGAASKPARPRSLLYFRTHLSTGGLGKLAVTSLDALDKVNYSTELLCARVHFNGSNGICLSRDVVADDERQQQIGLAFRAWLMSFTGYTAVPFDEHLKPGSWRIKLNGLPSRARVSPNGRLGAITVFLSGHSYTALSFSTQTIIIEMASGRVLADLEAFSVTRNGEKFQAPDFNFWGVTFTQDANRFYATLWSRGMTYLVECDLARRTANVVYEGVECPSLSPDETRVAFKKRRVVIGAPTTWRITLLDLRTLEEALLGESRSVDDQVEWLDNDTILYSLGQDGSGSGASADIWELAAANRGSPRVLLTGAASPAVVASPD